MKKKDQNRLTENPRETLAADVQAFLASGNQIQKIPTGVSGQDNTAKRKHIVLGGSKKRAADG